MVPHYIKYDWLMHDGGALFLPHMYFIRIFLILIIFLRRRNNRAAGEIDKRWSRKPLNQTNANHGQSLPNSGHANSCPYPDKCETNKQKRSCLFQIKCLLASTSSALFRASDGCGQ